MINGSKVKCSKCSATFESRGQRDSPNDRFHRLEVSVTFRDGTTSQLGRNSDGWFMCRCGKKYGRSRELLRKDHFQQVSTKEDDIWDLQACHQAIRQVRYTRERCRMPRVMWRAVVK